MADDLTTACIAAVAAIVGGLVTGAYGHALDRFRRPKLKIDYGQDAGAGKVTYKYKMEEKDVEEIIIRARLTNEGKTPARQCRVFLTSVKELVNNKEISTPILLTHTPARCRVIPVAGIKLGIGRRLCVASDAEQRTEGV